MHKSKGIQSILATAFIAIFFLQILRTYPPPPDFGDYGGRDTLPELFGFRSASLPEIMPSHVPSPPLPYRCRLKNPWHFVGKDPAVSDAFLTFFGGIYLASLLDVSEKSMSGECV